MTVVLSGKSNFKGKLTTILATAKEIGESNIVILIDKSYSNDIVNYLKDLKSIGKIKMGGNIFFIIKEMRLEVKPIDFYV
tara:strand:- start:663 stop:902 length:240 start_codon:yes stop_codon:yes gene_type:complete